MDDEDAEEARILGMTDEEIWFEAIMRLGSAGAAQREVDRMQQMIRDLVALSERH